MPAVFHGQLQASVGQGTFRNGVGKRHYPGGRNDAQHGGLVVAGAALVGGAFKGEAAVEQAQAQAGVVVRGAVGREKGAGLACTGPEGQGTERLGIGQESFPLGVPAQLRARKNRR